MSFIRAIKMRLGLSVTPANNFTLDASADNGTMKLTRESGQDVMAVDAAGKVNFSVGILGFSYGTSGGAKYIGLPSWLGNVLIQWGNAQFAGGTTTTAYFATAFASNVLTILLGHNLGAANGVIWTAPTTTQTTITIYTGATGTVSWLAIGVKP